MYHQVGDWLNGKADSRRKKMFEEKMFEEQVNEDKKWLNEK
jgi:hypothetical protein